MYSLQRTNLVLATFSLILPAVLGDLTLYTTAATTGTAAAATATYDTTRLTPPDPPSPPTTSSAITVPDNGQAVWDAGYQKSIDQQGNFLGFSIEMSVANTVLGKNTASIHPQILNYLANIQNRAKVGARVRVGGNSQEGSSIWAGGFGANVTGSIVKIKDSDAANTTPIVEYSPDLLYTMSNISALIGVNWYFGLSFNETAVENPAAYVPLAAQYAAEILGDYLLGQGLGNEPDLYVDHNHRPAGWTLSDYLSEYSNMTAEILSLDSMSDSAVFMGPSLCCSVEGFDNTDLLSAGWLTSNLATTSSYTVQRYPRNNCQIGGVVINPQDIFAEYLNHTSAQYLTSLYTDTSSAVVAAGKPLLMLEMNTASCGGFPGLSDSFGAALWTVDWALQMAYGNFTAALMHTSGADVYYNPFTPPSSNLSKTAEWTTGSIYYSTLVVAEALGSNNISQVVDLTAQTDMYHPVYAVYENDAPTRLVLINFVSDATGASLWSPTITTTATEVSVRYLTAPDVAEQYNITWAGQTMLGSYESDGRLYGDLETVNITCTDGECTIPVAAPQIALVFLTQQALEDSSVTETATSTFATTVSGTGSATVNPQVVATSNGENGPAGVEGSNSEGSVSGAARTAAAGLTLGAGLLVAGVVLGAAW